MVLELKIVVSTQWYVLDLLHRSPKGYKRLEEMAEKVKKQWRRYLQRDLQQAVCWEKELT